MRKSKKFVQPLSKQASATEIFKVLPISKATQTQRIGRVGRNFPGKVIMLYSKEDEEKFIESDYSENLMSVSLLTWYNKQTTNKTTKTIPKIPNPHFSK